MREPLPWPGGCRCGRVRLTVTKRPLLTMACHCSGCQTMTGSAFSLTMTLPADGLTVSSGELVRGGLQTEHRHEYCAFCKTWVLTRPNQLDWIVNLRPSTLDAHAHFEPFIETYTREKIPWARTPAVHHFEGVPSYPDYQPLMDEFKARYYP